MQIKEKPLRSGQRFLLGRMKGKGGVSEVLEGGFQYVGNYLFFKLARVIILHAILCISNVNKKKLQHYLLQTQPCIFPQGVDQD